MHLSVGYQQIEIDITDPAWCKCWLHDSVNRLYLGAECFNYLQLHLLGGLESKPDRIAGDIHGKEVSWILSLAEAHHVLYLANDGEDKVLFWQNEQGKVISEIKLPAEKVNEWIIELKRPKYNINSKA